MTTVLNAYNNLELRVIFTIDVPHYTKMLQNNWASESEVRGNIGYVLRRVPDEFYEFHGFKIQDAMDKLFQSLKCGRMLALRKEVYDELDRVYHHMSFVHGNCIYLFHTRDVAMELALYLGPQFDQGSENARALVESSVKRYKDEYMTTKEYGEVLNPEEFVPVVGEALLVALETINQQSFEEAEEAIA